MSESRSDLPTISHSESQLSDSTDRVTDINWSFNFFASEDGMDTRNRNRTRAIGITPAAWINLKVINLLNKNIESTWSHQEPIVLHFCLDLD